MRDPLPGLGVAFLLCAIAAGDEPGARPAPASIDLDLKHPRVDLVWFDPSQVLPCRPELVRREVAAIFGTIGVGVSWTIGGAGTTTGPGELQVILLAQDRSGDSRHAMGSVLGSAGPSRALWVVLAQVKRALALEDLPDGALSVSQLAQIGRAIGRVVAHEVIHAVAPGSPHAASGLMRRQLNRGELLRHWIPLDPSSTAAFVSALGGRGGGPEPAVQISRARTRRSVS